MDDQELVVLLDDERRPIGTTLKATVHTHETPLHLAFSCHVLDDSGRMLLTRRALTKPTFPGVWTNTFCGHPAPREALEEAVHRRAADELGAALADVECVLPDFAYRAKDAAGIEEHESCPVFVARLASPLLPNPTEIVEWVWVEPERLVDAVTATPFAFSPWLVEQLPQLVAAGAIVSTP